MNTIHEQFSNWIDKRPYLDEIGKFQIRIDTLLREQQRSSIILDELRIAKSLKQGIPAIKSGGIDVTYIENAGNIVIVLLEALQTEEIPGDMASQCRVLYDLVTKKPDLVPQWIESIIKNDRDFAEIGDNQTRQGIVLFLGWVALAHSLQDIKQAVEMILKKVVWRREHCPVCGQLPAMAQLVRTQKGREREFVCGCCKTRWSYQRIGCPICKNDNQKTLKILEVADEENMRIDVCENCNGYIKTYIDEGEEAVQLADWTTLHLDLLCKEEGYRRFGIRLYDI